MTTPTPLEVPGTDSEPLENLIEAAPTDPLVRSWLSLEDSRLNLSQIDRELSNQQRNIATAQKELSDAEAALSDRIAERTELENSRSQAASAVGVQADALNAAIIQFRDTL